MASPKKGSFTERRAFKITSSQAVFTHLQVQGIRHRLLSESKLLQTTALVHTAAFLHRMTLSTVNGYPFFIEPRQSLTAVETASFPPHIRIISNLSAKLKQRPTARLSFPKRLSLNQRCKRSRILIMLIVLCLRKVTGRRYEILPYLPT